MGHAFSPGEIMDAQDQDTTCAGAFHRAGHVLEDLIAGVDEDINLNTSIYLGEAEKLHQQVTFSSYHSCLTYLCSTF